VFGHAGPCGDYGFVEDYTAEVGGERVNVVVLVTRNSAGQTQRLEKFGGTPLWPSIDKALRKGHNMFRRC
jgi:hypothetical protein